jgi:hypothetical protein
MYYIGKRLKKQSGVCPWRKKKTSGNPSFLMFSGGEKTLALIISSEAIEKL